MILMVTVFLLFNYIYVQSHPCGSSCCKPSRIEWAFGSISEGRYQAFLAGMVLEFRDEIFGERGFNGRVRVLRTSPPRTVRGISTESGLSDLAPSNQATAREAYKRASASSEAWEAAADACVTPS